MRRETWISFAIGAVVAGIVGAFGVNPLIAVSEGLGVTFIAAALFTWNERRHDNGRLRMRPMTSEEVRRRVTPDQVDDPDPVLRAVVAEAFNTGKIVTAEVHDDGHAEVTVHDDE